jgi:hypothetical protein
MAWAFVLAMCGTVFGADKPPPPDAHTFTNKDGRTLNATITDVSSTLVSVKRNDGQAFKIPLATLSDADLDFIQQWAISAAQHWKGVFDISAVESRTDDVQASISNNNNNGYNGYNNFGRGGETPYTTWQSGFKITLNNQCGMDLKNLQVQYVLFWEQAVFPPSPGPRIAAARISDTMNLDATPALVPTTLETRRATLNLMVEQSSNGGYRMTPIKTTLKDKVQALWIRISDDKGNLLQEWSSDPVFTAKLNWDDVDTSTSPPGARHGYSPGAGRSPPGDQGGSNPAPGN